MTSEDMVIRVGQDLRSRVQGPRQKAEEKRKITLAERVKRSMLDRLKTYVEWRRFAAMRSAARSLLRPATGSGMGLAFRGALKAVGIAAIAGEAVVMMGHGLLRANGASGRLLEAQDADMLYGDLDEQATAAGRTRGRIESDEQLLRIIGIEGKVNSQINQLGEDIRQMELWRARGEDQIERDAHFDSPDSMLDKAFQAAGAKWGTDRLREKTDRAVQAMKRSWVYKAIKAMR